MLKRKFFGAAILAAASLSGLAAAGPAVFKAVRAQDPAFPEPVTTVRGVMVRNDAWGGSIEDAGIYTFEVKEGGAITCEHRSQAMASTVAALVHNGSMYAVEVDPTGYYYRTYNAANWATVGSRQEIDLQNVPSDLTYDPVTAKAYGGFYDEDYNGFSRFASFGLTDAEARDIQGNLDERDFIAIAAAPDGTIYALHGAYNYLKTIDPRTGSETKIGLTGIDCDVNPALSIVSSMTYDAENDRLIAIVSDNAGTRLKPVHKSALYVIDPRNTWKNGNSTMATVTKVADLPGNPAVAGLHVVEAAVAPDAPAAASGIHVEFASPAALSGRVVFTAPTLSAGGQPLTGELLAQVSVNGSVVATIGGISAGSRVSTEAITFPKGESTVKVVMAKPDLRGAYAEAKVFAGEDKPSAVSDLVLEITPEGWASLSWQAPAVGVNGGNLDPAALRYTVRRMQDNAIVASDLASTYFVDKDVPATIRAVSYSVVASNSEGASEPVESNVCLAGGALAVPYVEAFDTQEDFDLWTLINTNLATSWVYRSKDKWAAFKYAEDKTKANNWLISPAVRLEAGKAYKLAYSWRVIDKKYPESFTIHCGSAPTPEGMCEPLASHMQMVNTAWQSASTIVKPEADGIFYIGVHAVSDPWMYEFYVDNISIEEIDNRVPAVIADLSVEPGDKGALSATVSFTAPDKDNKGGNLESIDGVKLYRRGTEEAVKVFTDVQPGQKLSFTDTQIAASGLVGYSAVAYNELGEGVPADAEAFIGVDAPGAPTDVHISEVNGHLHLEWNAPLKGANGGWFDPAELSYRIVRSDGTVVAAAHKATEFTDTSISSPKDSQLAYWYLITPYSGEVKGAYAQSETLLFGAPYKTPAAEGFAAADMAFYPWIAQSSTAVNYAWTLDNMGYNPQVSDQNGDRGLATFHSVGEPVGSSAWFYSPKFDISTLDNPSLSFWVYRSTTPGDEKMEVYIAPESDTFVPAGLTVSRQADENGWVRYSLPLAEYASAAWIRVAFLGTGAGVEDMYLDNVAISSRVRFDAAVSAFKAPARIGAGIGFKAFVVVENMGSDDLSDLTVSVSDAQGVVLGSAGLASLAADAQASVEIEIPGIDNTGSARLTASVVAQADGNAANNSAPTVVKVVAPVLPAVTDLTGAADPTGGIALSWSAPSARGEVVDDFEGYKNFAIDGVGEWTMWDGDYDNTYMINTSYGEYPDATARKAFQVLNAEVLGINVWAQGTPHSGNKMMAALACQLYVNNDWLISPELNGAEQWISFWARSFTISETIPAERMRVFYSTSDNDPANFVELTSDYVELPDQWVEYRYFLPEGARYFAINCVSDDSFAMFVDDACFNDLSVPAWTLTGYDIYRNGQKIGSATETSFVDAAPEAKSSYTVVPVYDRGTGRESDAFVAELSSIGGIGAPAGALVNVYNLQGMLLRRQVPAAEATKGLPAGTYLVGSRKVRVD
ncbi:MAG: choice-of-anchor J domain-containing protein [Muribaculaceae bacterium]|nr:choice-of-anchor J domain-containing protein [Muribaculaceae bacterium]